MPETAMSEVSQEDLEHLRRARRRGLQTALAVLALLLVLLVLAERSDIPKIGSSVWIGAATLLMFLFVTIPFGNAAAKVGLTRQEAEKALKEDGYQRSKLAAMSPSERAQHLRTRYRRFLAAIAVSISTFALCLTVLISSSDPGSPQALIALFVGLAAFFLIAGFIGGAVDAKKTLRERAT